MIAPEGKIILIPLIFFVLIGTGIQVTYQINALKWVNVIVSLLTIFSLYFFRDPVRSVDDNPSNFISPADGKIVKIVDITDDDIGKAKQISIFLSVFDVHSQKVPYDAKVLKYTYNHGNFFAAFKHKASLDNEQTITLFEVKNGQKFKIKQIAGWIARRIVNYMKPEIFVNRGDRLGFIRFGSRVDIIVPDDFEISVSLDDDVRGNETVIGTFK
jgi:phosphatidylserine decarboxylase